MTFWPAIFKGANKVGNVGVYWKIILKSILQKSVNLREKIKSPGSTKLA